MTVENEIYNNIFVGNRDGAAILAELKRMYVDQPSYVKGDTHETAYKEGARAVVALIIRKSERQEGR